MSEDLDEDLEVENEESPIDRKDLLAKQFEYAENSSQERDENGRFKQANQEINKTKEEFLEEEPVWKKPPNSWKKEYHEAWIGADPKIQEYAWQREEEMRRGIEPLKEKAQFADHINQVIEPYLPTIRGLGIDPAAAIQGLMNADYTLRNSDPQGKRNYLMQLARAYGIDLSGQTNNNDFQAQSQNRDPNFYALQNELQSIRGEVASWKQEQERVKDQEILSEINSFSSKTEFFEEARPAMIQLLQSGMAGTLEEAYEKATRLDSDLFNKIQSRQQAESESKKRELADKAAKTAKAAALSVKTSAPGARPKAKAQDRRDLLREQFDELGGGRF